MRAIVAFNRGVTCLNRLELLVIPRITGKPDNGRLYFGLSGRKRCLSPNNESSWFALNTAWNWFTSLLVLATSSARTDLFASEINDWSICWGVNSPCWVGVVYPRNCRSWLIILFREISPARIWFIKLILRLR